ncbi:MAG: peptidoglycan-associated lipoprotein Pal [Pseudomonadota bacterium]
MANKLLITAFLALILAGCTGSNTVPDPDPTDSQMGGDSGAGSDGSEYDPFGGDEVPDDSRNPGEDLASVIYFEFDSSELRPEDTDTVARHAMLLGDNAGMTVRLEGHADERGSREYNIGLGERRAQTVRRMLLIQGASASQVSTVSFGEERPAAMGSDESAYSQNRRVVIVYTNQ